VNIGISNLIDLGATLTMVLGSFFKLRNEINSHKILIKNNSEILSQVDEDIKQIKNKLENELIYIKTTFSDKINAEEQIRTSAMYELENKIMEIITTLKTDLTRVNDDIKSLDKYGLNNVRREIDKLEGYIKKIEDMIHK